MLEHPFARRELDARPPGERCIEHLPQERRLVRTQIADLHGVRD
jgi:hypothetical protein